MCPRVTIVYNEPQPSIYDRAGEGAAVQGILQSVTAVRDALIERGYPVDRLPLVPPREDAVALLEALDTDIVFNLFEGFCGQPETEPIVPEILVKRAIAFTGCRAETLRLCLDKSAVKIILRAAGVLTPDYQLLGPTSKHWFKLHFPCIVKPCGDDASHGITKESVVYDFASLSERVLKISTTYGGDALVERFITGREFNATVLAGGQVLPVSEIVFTAAGKGPRLLTYSAKWEPGSKEYRDSTVVCPAELGKADQRLISRTALRAWNAIGCTGCARVDMRMDEDGNLYVLEINPNPDISPDAGAARQAAAAGMTYADLIETLLGSVIKKEESNDYHPAHDGGGQTSDNAHPPAYA